MIIGNREFDIQRHCYIMGILNMTPDSFSDGGKYNNVDKALLRVEEMINEGCDIVDVGGESTRPGYEEVCDEEEIYRTASLIEKIKTNFDVPVSIDTYKSSVAEAALKSGADLVNDIWGFRKDDRLAHVTSSYKAACCLMHNRRNDEYDDFLKDVVKDLEKSVEIAKNAGIPKDKIMVDPGVGFAKTYEQNLMITNHIDMLKETGCPILLGTSRKSMIGLALDLPVDMRLEGTLATTVIGVVRGCSFVRVHDIKENRRVIKMTEEILKK